MTMQDPQGGSQDRQAGELPTLDAQLPVNYEVTAEIVRLLGEQKFQSKRLLDLMAQDLVVAIEVLAAANAPDGMGRTGVTTLHAAAVALGVEKMRGVFDKLLERSAVPDNDLADRVEQIRVEAQRVGIVAAILAGAAAKSGEEALAAGMLAATGEMLAVVHLRERYAALAEKCEGPSQLRDCLRKECGFDVEAVTGAYLSAHAIPVRLVEIVAGGKSAGDAKTRMCVLAAQETVERFDSGKWESLSSGSTIPPGSALAKLQLSEEAYQKAGTKIDDFFASGVVDEDVSGAPPEEMFTPQGVQIIKHTPASPSACAPLLDGRFAAGSAAPDDEAAAHEITVPVAGPQLDEAERVVMIDTESCTPVFIYHAKVEPLVHPPAAGKPKPSRVQAALQEVELICRRTKAADKVEERLIRLLTSCGAFYRAASLAINEGGTDAHVRMGTGPGLVKGTSIPWTTISERGPSTAGQVSLFKPFQDSNGPFNCKAYALALLGASENRPLVLYADCGEIPVVPFEARRLLRAVVQKLQEPGQGSR